MKKTAIDFAAEQLEKLILSGNQIIIEIILKKAKEMEMEQMLEVSKEGIFSTHEFEQYYNETYGKDA